MKAFRILWIVVFFALAIGMAGCAPPAAQLHTGNRDHFAGWFKLPGRNEKKEVIAGHDTLIPVFKRDGNYYSVCRGFEVPLKECPDGLEWALTPSSMAGTKIGWDAAAKTYYLAVMDQQASNFTDSRYGCGEKEPMTRIEKPAGLLDARARRPRSNDDFLGRYQPVWFPWVRIEIRKDGSRFVSHEQEFHGPAPGSWTTRIEPGELTPLPDQLGFSFERHGIQRFIYNDGLKRFELVMMSPETPSSVVRIPLARVSTFSSTKDGNPPRPAVKIGIPSWH